MSQCYLTVLWVLNFNDFSFWVVLENLLSSMLVMVLVY